MKGMSYGFIAMNHPFFVTKLLLITIKVGESQGQSYITTNHPIVTTKMFVAMKPQYIMVVPLVAVGSTSSILW